MPQIQRPPFPVSQHNCLPGLTVFWFNNVLEVYDACHNLRIPAEKLVQVLLTRTINISNKNSDIVPGTTKGIFKPELFPVI